MIPIPVLKTAVIVMGVLIVAGLVVIVMKISQKSGELAENMVTTGTDVETPQDDAVSFRLDLEQLDLDVNARLLSMDVAGERLVLRVRTGEGIERVVIVDVKSGAVVGEVALPVVEQ